jgi:hypothetical protein
LGRNHERVDVRPPLSDTLLDRLPLPLTGVSPGRLTANIRLVSVLRKVIRADSDPARQTLFSNLRQSHLWVRLVCRLHERLRGTRAATLVIACYGLISFLTIVPPRKRGARVLAVGQFENARRQIDRVSAWIGRADCDVVGTSMAVLFGPALVVRLLLLMRGRGIAKALRTAGRIDRRHGLLVSCRAIRAIAWYVCARTILEKARPGAVVVASDSNPEELGFIAAAKAGGIPQVFISHAYPTPFSPSLDFTLSILEGQAAVAARRRKGPIKGDVLLAGIEGDSSPLDASRFRRPAPVIGLFPPKAVSWPTLAAIVDDCRRHFGAAQIIIRWHPSMLERPRLADWVPDRSNISVASSRVPVADVAERCDWVVADENSNVHLPVLKMGIPTIAVRKLGLYPASRADLYGFIADGIVFPAVDSVREVRAEALDRFFGGDWPHRFRSYDASYLRPGDAVGSEVRSAIQSLLERRRSSAVFG